MPSSPRFWVSISQPLRHRSIRELATSRFKPTNIKSPSVCRQHQKPLPFRVHSCWTSVSTAYLDRTDFLIHTRFYLKNTKSVLPSPRLSRRRNNIIWGTYPGQSLCQTHHK